MSRENLPLAAVLLVVGLLGACGQKGPLYLPQEAASPAPAGAVAQPAVAPAVAPAGTAASPAETEAQDEEEETRRDRDSATADELEPAIEK